MPGAHSGSIVIAGGSGFLGVSLATWLANRGRSIVILSRRPPALDGPWRHVRWDARRLGDWGRELSGAAGLVNLVGRSVDCAKTPEHCDEILRSRVEATRVLGQALRTVEDPPPVWVQMSTAHIYGDPPKITCTEDSPFGYGLARRSLLRHGKTNFGPGSCRRSAAWCCERASCSGGIGEWATGPWAVYKWSCGWASGDASDSARKA